MAAVKQKTFEVVTTYGEKIKVKEEYMQMLSRLMNGEHYIPRNYAEKHMIRRFFQKPDFHGKRGGLAHYVDIETPRHIILRWSSLTQKEQEAFRDYFVLTMVKAYKCRPAGPEEAARQEKRMKEVREIINAK